MEQHMERMISELSGEELLHRMIGSGVGCLGMPENHPPLGNCDRLQGYSLAMVYCPCQEWQKISSAEEGFGRGTIFDELYLPFYGDRKAKGGCGCGQ